MAGLTDAFEVALSPEQRRVASMRLLVVGDEQRQFGIKEPENLRQGLDHGDGQAGVGQGFAGFHANQPTADDDGFAAVRELRGLAIAVGARPAPLAHFALACPAAVRDWLGV